MTNHLDTHIAIAEILSSKDNSLKIKTLIAENRYNWEDIVFIGSKYLMLPAIYFNLKQKKLLPCLPDDLVLHLEHIAKLNTERNLKILQQLDFISNLFNSKKINHVFLKGCALLKSRLYKDIGERMIGDIDILIDGDDIQKSFDLLLKTDYKTLNITPGDTFLNPKHLPRIISDKENHICAVELHNRLFENYQNKELHSGNLLLNKNEINGFSIPSSKHLLMHTILNWQINDKGFIFKSFSFRSAYDTLLLLNQNKELKTEKWLLKKPIQNYIQILSVVFPEESLPLSKKSNLDKRIFILKFKNKAFKRAWLFFSKLLFTISFFTRRIFLAIKKPQYFKVLIYDFKNSWSRLKGFLK